MTAWIRAIAAGIFGGLCVAGLLTSTSGELEPLVAVAVPGFLQIPGLIVIGLLIGLAVPAFGHAAAAYFTAIIVASAVHILIYAIPGFETANYTTARFNNGFSTSLFVIMFGGIFVLVGQGLAVGLNVYARGLYD